MMRQTRRYLLLLIFYATNYFGPGVSQLESSTQQASSPSYAKNFEIARFPTHCLITVKIVQSGAVVNHRYAIISKDNTSIPELPKGTTIIRTPIERVVVLETIHIGYLDALDKLDTLVGAPSINYISNSIVRTGIQANTIQQVKIGSSLDVEKLLLLQPDLVLTSTSESQGMGISSTLLRSGLPIVFTAEYKEHHLLARAEWIKFIAEFFDADEKANEYFETTATRYEFLSAKTKTIAQRPTVFSGAPYSGVWHVASGESYIAQAIHDAGGSYLWNHISGSNAIPLSTEHVFLKAANADIWINPSFYRSYRELYGADPRFKKFHAAQTGNVYNHTRQQRIGMGNPIWETGIVHPDEVLADLIKIFHPDQMPDWNFVYYEQLQ